jgi:uncharacterized protein YnzC (UPF0291/DUF896 family)
VGYNLCRRKGKSQRNLSRSDKKVFQRWTRTRLLKKRNIEYRQREKFRCILFELARVDRENDEKIINGLKDLYGTADDRESFRHFYSDIALFVAQYPEHATKALANLEAIRFSPHFQPETKKQINKLYDHISLEVARIRYQVARIRYLDEIKEDLKKSISSLEKFRDECEDLKRKIQNTQREYVGVLGIFVSIILAFSGFLSFNKNMFENVSVVSPWILIILSIISGLTLAGTLKAFFCYIHKLLK